LHRPIGLSNGLGQVKVNNKRLFWFGLFVPFLYKTFGKLAGALILWRRGRRKRVRKIK
jgi:uncharacterized membrane protein